MRKVIITIVAILLVFGLNLKNGETIADTFDLGPSVAQARRGGGGSFRSPSRPSRPRPSRSTSPSKARASSSASKARPSPKTSSAVSKTSKPKPTATAASVANKRQSSSFKQKSAARSTVRTSSGKHVQVAGTPAAKSVRGMSANRYSSRSSRKASTYSSIPARQQTIIINSHGGGFYGDPYSGLFMYSLLSMSIHNQARFHHNHWDSYSVQRQSALMSENAQLRAEMASIKAPRDPNYVPEGTDSDLLYTDEFVTAAYNPEKESSGFSWGFWATVIGGTSLILSLGYLFVAKAEA